jgi:hypothetical protein
MTHSDPPGFTIPADLLLCLRRGADLSPLIELSAHAWQVLVDGAHQHYLAPLLYQRLKREALVPPQVLEALRLSYYRNLAENARKFALLGQVLARLGEAGMRVILLKGAYLADQVYGDVGLRPMGDFDLLLPRPEVQRAFGILQGMGFQAERPFREEAYGKLHYHSPQLEMDGVIIELHWSLTLESTLRQLDPAVFWDRARRVNLQGVEAWALCPGDLLLHLSVHAAYGHRFSGQLHSLVDLDRALAKEGPGIDWPAFIHTCRTWQAQRGTYLTLRLMDDVLETHVPAHVLSALRPPNWTEQPLEWARVHLFQTEPVLSEYFTDLIYGTNPWERFSALLKGLFPSRGLMSMIYGIPTHSWRIVALYPRHAISRITRYWGHAGQFMRGDRRQEFESKSDIALREWLHDL